MKQIKATRPDHCHNCGDDINVGETFWWATAEAYCLDCGPPITGQPAGGTTTDEDVPGYVLQLRKEIDALASTCNNLKSAVKTMHDSATTHNKVLLAMAEWIEQLSVDLDIKAPDFPR